MQTFFKRLSYIVESEGFKNLNDFALNGLKYESSSKLNRLKDDKNKPSVEILLDIANKFENINLHWLVTGKGDKSLKQDFSKQPVDEIKPNVAREPILYGESELVKTLKENVAYLKKEIEELKDDKELLKSIVKTKLGKANAS